MICDIDFAMSYDGTSEVTIGPCKNVRMIYIMRYHIFPSKSYPVSQPYLAAEQTPNEKQDLPVQEQRTKSGEVKHCTKINFKYL